ncbi:MAG: C25 family cysteine peptidase [Candidatus Cloacimonetes bacterium]|nr:C25 family cysteine peptidase [Candidatus Cloacimonadota bacterium]
MYKYVTLIMLIFFSSSFAINFEIVNSNENNLNLSLNTNSYEIMPVRLNETEYDQILFRGSSSLEPGSPDLPAFAVWIAIPNDKKPSVSFSYTSVETIDNLKISPRQHPSPDAIGSKEPEFYLNKDIYSENTYYPGKKYKLERTAGMRDYQMAILWVFPFQYNPVTRQLDIYHDVTVQVNFLGTTSPISLSRKSVEFEALLKSTAINGKEIADTQAEIRYLSEKNRHRDPGCDYLIITHSSFLNSAQTLSDWKKQLGFETMIATTEETGSSSQEIENYIDYAYYNWNNVPDYLLFLGDAEFVPTKYVNYHPYNEGMTGSDLHYADINNPPDYIADFLYGRISVETEAQADSVIARIIRYEMNPPQQASFYQTPLMAAAFQDGSEDYPPDQIADRRFSKTSEDLRNYLLLQGYNPERVYATYNGYNNEEIFPTYWNEQNWAVFENDIPMEMIPDEIQKPLFPWDGNSFHLDNALNNGRFFLLHRDHGSRHGWGEPDFDSDNVFNLNNGELRPIVWSINCQTGWFDNETDSPSNNTDMSSECFVESWFRHNSGGSIGVFGSTRVSYSGHNDRLVWGWSNAIWNGFLAWCNVQYPPSETILTLGNVMNYGKLYYMTYFPDDITRTTTMEQFQYFGDPSMKIRTSVPLQITAEHQENISMGEASMLVMTNVSDGTASLTFDNEILAVQDINSGIAVLHFPPISQLGELLLTITADNSVPYIASIELTASQGPYVILNDVEFTDDNDNNQIDYNEEILFNVELKNFGSQTAENITAELSSDNNFVTIIENVNNWDNILPGETLLLQNAFQVYISPFIPDQQEIIFNLNISDNNDNWQSNFSYIANAPDLKITQSAFLDFSSGNGNGIPDSGEILDIIITVYNDGNSDISEINSTLSSNNDFVLIENPNLYINQIPAHQPTQLIYSLEISQSAAYDQDFVLSLNLTSDSLNYIFDRSSVIGNLRESFESDSFISCQWEHSGNNFWTTTNQHYHDGLFSARSGDISHNQQSILSLTLPIAQNGEISFWKKLSTQNYHDKLIFLIDDVEMGIWSGNLAWSESSYQVSAGNRTFTWIYQKDEDVSSDDDCVWIDCITFPELTPLYPEIGINVSAFDFGTIPVGTSSYLDFQISNTGQIFLSGSIDHEEMFQFSENNGSNRTRNNIDYPNNNRSSRNSFIFSVPPQSTNSYRVAFSPEEIGNYDGTFSFDNNSGNDIVLTVEASASENLCLPPQNVSAQSQSEGILLSWDYPSDAQNVITWSNSDYSDSFGTGGTIHLQTSVRFEIEDLSSYNEMYLHAITFYPTSENCEYTLKVWRGGHVAEGDISEGELIMSQTVENFTVYDWNKIELQNPVQINSSQELWFGYEFDAQGGYPASLDSSESIPWKGDMLKLAGNWISLSNSPNWNGNWCIIGHLSNFDPATPTPELTRNSSRKNRLSRGDLRLLSGYNIYRDNSLLTYISNPTQLNYTDLEVQNNQDYSYYLTSVYDGVESDASDTVYIYYSSTDNSNGIVFANQLSDNYPNPFFMSAPTGNSGRNHASETKIDFSISESQSVTLEIYNIKGQSVKTLVNSFLKRGNHQAVWNGTDSEGKAVSSGIYLYKLELKNYSRVKPMVLLK